MVPLWQVKHMPLTPEWSKFAGSHAAVLWQSSQAAVVGRWLEGLPGATDPLWQLAQVPITCAWSVRAGSQALVVWQSAQTLVAVR